jgi:DNA-binding NtrC family response regulator
MLTFINIPSFASIMRNISSAVEKALRKHRRYDPVLAETLSSNLEFRLLFNVDLSKPFREAKKDFIKNYLNDLLVLSLGNITLAAKMAHLHRRQIHRIINDLDIDASGPRRELLKPSEYMMSYVNQILEETISLNSPDDKKGLSSELDDISFAIVKNIDSPSYDEALDFFEKEYIEKALKQNNYNVARTADTIDISERTLYRKINKLNIAVA